MKPKFFVNSSKGGSNMQQKLFVNSILAALLIVAASVTFAVAQDQVELTSRAEVEKVTTNTKGERVVTLKPADKVLPGEVVVFTNSYRNPGQQPATSAAIENAVPEHMTLVTDTVFGENCVITYSVDGGKTYAAPDALLVSDASGRMWPAETRDYTHIRWTLQGALAPQQTGEVGFKARLN